MRKFTLVAGLAWLIVAGYGLLELAAEDGDDWSVSYAVFSLALVVGVALTLVAAARSTRDSARPRLRAVGLGVAGLGGAAAIVGAWALPLWMTVLGVGFATITVACEPGERRAVGLLAAAQLVGLAVLFAGLIAEVGRRDEWGDHPMAGGIALIVTAALAIAGLVELTRDDRTAVPA
jgi:hypothetical protein